MPSALTAVVLLAAFGLRDVAADDEANDALCVRLAPPPPIHFSRYFRAWTGSMSRCDCRQGGCVDYVRLLQDLGRGYHVAGARGWS